jgi:hypothetical protein
VLYYGEEEAFLSLIDGVVCNCRCASYQSYYILDEALDHHWDGTCSEMRWDFISFSYQGLQHVFFPRDTREFRLE